MTSNLSLFLFTLHFIFLTNFWKVHEVSS